MKPLILFLLFTISLSSTPIKIPVKEVLIYRDRVQVTRISKLKAPPGETLFSVDSISPRLLEETLRVVFSEKENLRVSSINSYIEPLVKYNNKEVEDIKKKIRDLETQKKDFLVKINIIQQKKNQLIEFKNLTTNHISRKVAYIEEPNFDFTEWRQSISYFKERQIQLEKEEVELNTKLSELNKNLDIENTKLSTILQSSDKSIRKTDIKVVNTSKQEIESGIRLSYIIPGATWNPIYNVMLINENQVEIEYMAEISQETGEDWELVEVSLSTAEPKSKQYRKRVKSVELSLQYSENVQKNYYAYEESTREEESDTGKEAIDTNRKQTEGNVNRAAGSLIFKAKGNSNIPSGKDIHRIFISRFQDNLKTAKLSVPSIKPNVYTEAKATNKIDFPLLPGKLSLFGSSGYIGETQLNYIPAGQEFNFSAGIDNNFKIKYRVENSNELNSSLLGNSRVIERLVVIEVKNLSKKRETISIKDRIPVSDIDTLKIEMDKEKTTPGFKEIGTNSSVYEWNLEMEPGSKKEIKLGYKMTAPSSINIDLNKVR